MGSGKSDNDSVGVENDGGNAKPSPILITTGNNPQSSNPNSQSSQGGNWAEGIKKDMENWRKNRDITRDKGSVCNHG